MAQLLLHALFVAQVFVLWQAALVTVDHIAYLVKSVARLSFSTNQSFVFKILASATLVHWWWLFNR
jgi:hypothetical protein